MSDTLSQPIEEMTELRALQAQRNERLLGDRPPPQKDSAARADFEQNVVQDQDAIEQRRQRVLDWAEKASPDQIAALQAKIQEADKAVRDAKPDDKHEQVVHATVAQWRQQRGAQREETPPMLTREQRMDNGPGRLGYADYARSSLKEAAFMKDYAANYDWEKHQKQAQPNVFRQ